MIVVGEKFFSLVVFFLVRDIIVLGKLVNFVI